MASRMSTLRTQKNKRKQN